ncbi:MAG: hypothetical protein ACPLTR_05920 [Thermacetogeniaceae bacterium]
MSKRGYRVLAYFMLLVCIAGGIRLLQGGILSRRMIPPDMEIHTNTLYTVCGHERENPVKLTHREVLTVGDLLKLYPPKEGWKIEWLSGKIELRRQEEALCPSCQKKSHVGRKGDFVAVIRGPVGVDGGIIRVTPIKLSSLPQTIRKEVEKGTLDVPDEKVLMQILDSLEEETE